MDEMVTVQLTVPEEWMQDLKDQAALLEILGLGLEEYRLQRALALYQRGAGSIGYVAELVGIPQRVLIEKARQRGVFPQYDEQLAEQDLKR
jgi:predicted HTH domain antitoxin